MAAMFFVWEGKIEISSNHKISKLLVVFCLTITLPETNIAPEKMASHRPTIDFFKGKLAVSGRLVGQFLHLYESQRLQVDGSEICEKKQLRLVVYLITYRVFYPNAGCLGFLNHQLLWQHCRCIPMALLKPTKKWLRPWGRENQWKPTMGPGSSVGDPYG